jgi:dolichol-phosphate mannosyltransferase
MIQHRDHGARRAPRLDTPPVAGPARPILSVVICTLDEHEAIGGVLDDLSADLIGESYEIIVVDDSADDRTAEVVLARARHHPALRLIRRGGAGGLASAAIAGWDVARGEILAIMDGDGQHDPRLIGRMADRMSRTPVDVIVASRYLGAGGSGLTGYRDWLSRTGVRVSGLLLGLRLADPLSGCFVMTRAWYQTVRPRLSGLGFKILIDVVASDRRRPSLLQVPTALRPRAGGVSKLDLRVVFDLVALLIEKRTRGMLTARMSQFLFVGLTGLLVHVLALATGRALGAPFWLGQSGAILVAMSWNFLLNNSLTFRDRKLRGRAAWQGLLSFYAACLGGAFVSAFVGAGLDVLGAPWFVAGLAGALMGATCNYGAAQRLTWRPAKAVVRARTVLAGLAGKALR